MDTIHSRKLLLTFLFFLPICLYFFNADISLADHTVNSDVNGNLVGNDHTVTGDVTGTIIGKRNTVQGNVGYLGAFGNENTVWGNVNGDITGNDNVVCQNVLGNLAGNDNVIWGDVSGIVSGNRNIIYQTPGSGPCSRTSPPSVPTPTPTPRPSPPPSSSGNITNLNFGINNSQPWIQAVCGDIRIDSGIENPQSTGQLAIATNATCDNPGIAFTGNATADFGDGQASSTNHVVGGATYPEVYSPSSSGGIFSSYTYLSQKAQSAQVPQTNLTGICTLSNCTLPPNLPNGIYYSPTNLVLNGYTFPANRDYVFLVNGTLTIGGNIIVPPSSNSSVVFSAANNIIVRNTVGSAPASNAPNLSAIFSTDRSLILESTNNCSDLRLNIEGTIIVNAGLTGGFLQNNRDLCGSNATAPTMQIRQRLGFVLNLPEFVRIQQITSQEAAP